MSKLKIAIQKSGRLNEDSLKLLKSCGIKVDNGKDQLKVDVPNFPMEILYLRNSDIPQYLDCLLYTSPSPRDATLSRMPSSA